MKMRTIFHGRRFIAFAVMCLILMTTACASRKLVRTSDAFTRENPVKKIAVLGEGRVMLTEMKQTFLDMDESKTAVETLVLQACDAFTQKGYDVVLCEPAGIGYFSPLFPENWVYDKNGENNSKKQIQNREPAYVYQYEPNDNNMKAAVRNIFERVESEISKKQESSFSASREDVAAIQQATGADTICFNYICGGKQSTGAAAASAAVSAAVGLLLNSSGGAGHGASVGSYFFCVSAGTGETRWQYGKNSGGLRQFSSGDTFSYNETFAEQVLRHFPDIGNPMDAKYLQENVMQVFIKNLLMPWTIND